MRKKVNTVNTSYTVCKPGEDLQETFDLCHCQQRLCYDETYDENNRPLSLF